MSRWPSPRGRRSTASCRERFPSAVSLSLVEKSSVTASMYGIDVNYLQVKINEGALLPTVTVQAGVSTSYQQTLTVFRTNTASAIATASVPIFSGRRRIFAYPPIICAIRSKAKRSAPRIPRPSSWSPRHARRPCSGTPALPCIRRMSATRSWSARTSSCRWSAARLRSSPTTIPIRKRARAR